MPLPAFRFKKFDVAQAGAAHPVGTDAVLLGAWADVRGITHFLDIGTGTGVVALMLAQRSCSGDFSRSNAEDRIWKGVAVEIHPPSATLARENFAASPWAKRLEVWESSIQAFANIDSLTSSETINMDWPIKPFDLIVSNPPFFSELTTSPDKTRSLGRHTATLSPSDLLKCVSHLLAPTGKFCAILPEFEGRRLCELSVPQGLYWTRIAEVRSRPGKPIERLLLQFEKSPYIFQREEFSIYAGKTGDEYSKVFQAMTRDFYL
ncbi:MAG: tRNA (adenosine(37)-N6)-methyltransferase TrmM [Phycisphaerae bacterium]|nr:tRNA (adenosine(37)-N6)-methyltransferase TrmM [Saprospiraceae bacterium]